MQCRDIDAIDTVYCIAEPCFRCAKELLNTGARRVVWGEPYGPEPQAGRLWLDAGRGWIQMGREND
jgi:deoxycytidylate deaminase